MTKLTKAEAEPITFECPACGTEYAFLLPKTRSITGVQKCAGWNTDRTPKHGEAIEVASTDDEAIYACSSCDEDMGAYFPEDEDIRSWVEKHQHEPPTEVPA